MIFSLKKKISNEFIGKVCIWLILSSCFYYPIGASIISLTKAPSTIVNIFIRSSFTLVSLILILLWVINNRKLNKQSINTSVFALLLFWLVYSVRIVYDTSNGIVFTGYDSFYVFGFAFGSILIPLLAIVSWASTINISQLPKLVFYILLLCNICILIIIIRQSDRIDISIFLKRIEFDSGSNQEGTLLNSITISFYGEMLLIVSAFHLSIYKKINIVLVIISFLLGILLLLLGASRGPFLSCIIVCVLMFMYQVRIKRFSIVFISKIILACLAFILVVINTLGNILIFENFFIFDRLTSFIEDRKNSEEETRDVLIKSAFNDFINSPIIGKQFVMTDGGFYPHNIFIEVIMATGIIGGLLFCIFFSNVLVKLYKFYFSENTLNFFMFIIYLPVLLGNLFSGSLFMSIDFWVLSVLIVVLSPDKSSYISTNNT